ncbi:hypothetical protein N7513_012065 [Penicillium frequentans]|uniref:HAT C-terminal dimerisation domain-containing protein n=1 Tax=Penicillium frequentans TaxID=3151616 RepID=A0AAD6CHI9_9EURO|nr:hypothetical protein N7494_013148 [Penicillium glabrum]KAJ5527906.1 hypothetical protein N7513_012065 [Penicillium glabrum]KAJ5543905.1 hypothetical protein N7494_005184 [Penicillium glabrum]KAJ5543970.1 hypothetical protein N7494_005249 [Penicillium glabrum]
MSQSQQTECGSQLSFCDIEPDDLSLITHSNYPATPSTSRQVDSFSFVQPFVPSSIAPDPLERFQRVGPGRRGQFFLYNVMNHTDWVDWWLETDYGSNNSKIAWESQHGSASETWKQFEQVAHTGNGSPKVMCKRCDTILEHPYATKKDANGKIGRHGTTTITRHLQTLACQKATGGHPFTQEAWEDKLLQFITINRLPFNLVEHPTFRDLVSLSQSAPNLPIMQSADTIRRRLSVRVKERQQDTLGLLPKHAKISVALDCWTSPFGQAFTAITGYFIDVDWVYREVLLGFKPLYGTHSGANLSAVLLETLTQHKIKDRVFGLTTDNASNNKTLVDTLQQSLSGDVHVIRIPCLAHVIQLSLNQLLDRLKAVPLNDAAETTWTDRQDTLARANANVQCREISHTLNKVRYLAIYIRGSPQRRDSFAAVQSRAPGQALMPIQDVRTRWNSTFLMLRRAKRLRVFITKYCDQFNCKDFVLDDDQWRQIDYLLCLTKPFFDYTLALSKTRDVTSHLVFQIYNLLFEHIERSKIQLQRKRVVWKKQMLISLEASHAKLRDYYKETDYMQGHIYAVCTMLSPDNRFQFFLSDDWADAKELRDQYRVAFRDALTPIQERLTSASAQGPQGPSPGSTTRSFLHNLVRTQKAYSKVTPGPVMDELTQYLDGNVTDSEPLSFWRENQFRFPAIAALARDVLAIPATGAGVERLFNTARDICHYRRGRMKSKTIEELMLFLCTSRFDLDVQEAKEIAQDLPSDEIDAMREQTDEMPDDVDVEEISDTEEQGDRPESVSEDLIDVDDEVEDNDATIRFTTAPSQVRTSGRKRKHVDDELYEHY